MYVGLPMGDYTIIIFIFVDEHNYGLNHQYFHFLEWHICTHIDYIIS